MPDRPHRNVVTRFAPSPTGYLHVGGARTALFNWAFARRHGGTFILRIEDTDAARSTAESTRRIIEDLVWLGLEWDEGPSADAIKTPDGDVYDLKSQRGGHGPYFQSQRNHLYTEYLARLVKIGRAYRCFKSQEQLKAERESQKASGGPMKYDPTEALNRSDADQLALIAAGKPFVWRFRMPDADVTVHDLVLGDVTIKAAELEDFVIIKAPPPGSASSNDISAAGITSGGGPTFHFANVVDDATMEVTHVLRAQEHLMNTPKHVAMFDALGIARPKYAHMPLIFNPDGTKMSKRDKAKTARAAAKTSKLQAASGIDPKTFAEFLDKKNDDPNIAIRIASELRVALPEIDVHDFAENDYLPEVLLNYLALLGWNPGGNLEHFDREFLKREFDIERLGKSNAKFDRQKLLAFNAEAYRKLSREDFAKAFARRLETSPWGNVYFCFPGNKSYDLKLEGRAAFFKGVGQTRTLIPTTNAARSDEFVAVLRVRGYRPSSFTGEFLLPIPGREMFGILTLLRINDLKRVASGQTESIKINLENSSRGDTQAPDGYAGRITLMQKEGTGTTSFELHGRSLLELTKFIAGTPDDSRATSNGVDHFDSDEIPGITNVAPGQPASPNLTGNLKLNDNGELDLILTSGLKNELTGHLECAVRTDGGGWYDIGSVTSAAELTLRLAVAPDGVLHVGEDSQLTIQTDGDRAAKVAAAYQARATSARDAVLASKFFWIGDHEIEYSPQAVEKVLKSTGGYGQAVLRELVPVLNSIDMWTPESIHAAVEKFAADTKRGMGDVAQPIRVAVSGTTVSPPIHDTLAILGKQSTINRLNRAAAL